MADVLAEDFWPLPLRHCARPLLGPEDEDVTIGEISGATIDGFVGNRRLYAALVPEAEVSSVLSAVGGIGHGVSYDARLSESGVDRFSVYGPSMSIRFESLVHSWLSHNRMVLLPNDSILAYYDLTPQIFKDQISWDDLSRPVYDVIRATPVSIYTSPNSYTPARITIRRDYLEDYLTLRACAAVAVYWDERYSKSDPEVTALVGKHGAKFEQPGRELWFLPMGLDWADQVSQVWGCALLLRPGGKPISAPPETALEWPDRRTPIIGLGADASFEPFEIAYVRDEVLSPYEERAEFEVSPEKGFVSYDDRWSVSYCDRVSRNCIELELRKLYEGAPIDVIKHYNRFAVSATTAQKDSETFGTRHIGARAKDLVQSFLWLTSTISKLSDALKLYLPQEDVGGFSSADVEYSGWWTFRTLKPLGHVVPVVLPVSDFHDRCTEVFKLLENLRPSALRSVVLRLGVKKPNLEGFGSLKLLATICQLAAISREKGLDLVVDCAQACSAWQVGRKVQELDALFALNALRTADSHKQSDSTPSKVAAALGAFGIDEKECRRGWGVALDTVYDHTKAALDGIGELIAGSFART